MKTLMYHSRLGCYNFLNPSEKSKSYKFVFDENDKENKTITFDYDEENAPDLDEDNFSVLDLIYELENYKSTKFSYSSSYNHIGEKSHEERIKLAKELAEINQKEDDTDFANKLEKGALKLEEKAQKLRKKATQYREG